MADDVAFFSTRRRASVSASRPRDDGFAQERHLGARCCNGDKGEVSAGGGETAQIVPDRLSRRSVEGLLRLPERTNAGRVRGCEVPRAQPRHAPGDAGRRGRRRRRVSPPSLGGPTTASGTTPHALAPTVTGVSVGECLAPLGQPTRCHSSVATFVVARCSDVSTADRATIASATAALPDLKQVIRVAARRHPCVRLGP